MKKKVLGIIAAITLLFSGCNETKPVPGSQPTTVTPTGTSEVIPTSSSEEEQPISSEITTSSGETPASSSEPTTSDSTTSNIPSTSEEPTSSEVPSTSEIPGSSEEPSTPSTPTSEEPVTPVDPEPSEPEETEHVATFNPTTELTDTDGTITWVNSSDYGSTVTTELRIYKGQTLTISGAKITKVEFTCTASGTTKQGPGCWGTGAPDGYSYEGKNGTWEGEATELVFRAVDNQVRIKTLTITYLA